MTRIRFAIALALTFASLAPHAAAQTPPSRTGVEWRLMPFDLSGYPSIVESVDKVPLAVRQIPVHPGDPDGYDIVIVQFRGIGPIPQKGPGYRLATVSDDHVELGGMLTLGVGFGPTFRVRGLRLLAGATYNLPYTSGPHRDSSGNTREWNYFGGGATRGYGTALVYYTVTTNPQWLIPGAQIEVSRDREGFTFLGGYRMTPYKLVFETGWDRYDRSEGLKTYDISNNYLHTLYAGIGGHGLQFTVGPTFQTVRETAVGRATVVNYRSVAWRIGVGYAVTFNRQ